MLTVLCGTNRPESFTRKIASQVLETYNVLGRPAAFIDLAEIPHEALSPSFYGDDEISKHKSLNPYIRAMQEATALVVISPEYNGGMAGALKLFIDMLPGRDYILVGRAVCFIGVAAGDWGGLRPTEQLETVFVYRKAFVFPERVLVRRCEEAFDNRGSLIDDGIRRRLKGQAERFIRFSDQVRPLMTLFDKVENPASLEHPETMAD